MIEFERRTAGDLFSNPLKGDNGSFFTIPRFQRKYEWESRHEVRQLLEDIYDNMGHGYFMGTITFCVRAGARNVEIIDGQQRLVTLAILVRATVDYIQRIKHGTAPAARSCRPSLKKSSTA